MGSKGNDFLILGVTDPLELFSANFFTGGPARAPKKFKNYIFQM